VHVLDKNEALIPSRRMLSVPSSAPMIESVPSSAPMIGSVPSSAPMIAPILSSAPMIAPIPSSAPMIAPVPTPARGGLSLQSFAPEVAVPSLAPMPLNRDTTYDVLLTQVMLYCIYTYHPILEPIRNCHHFLRTFLVWRHILSCHVVSQAIQPQNSISNNYLICYLILSIVYLTHLLLSYIAVSKLRSRDLELIEDRVIIYFTSIKPNLL
jgi:hypothetical protein